jgi:hypothetical protein
MSNKIEMMLCRVYTNNNKKKKTQQKRYDENPKRELIPKVQQKK